MIISTGLKFLLAVPRLNRGGKGVRDPMDAR